MTIAIDRAFVRRFARNIRKRTGTDIKHTQILDDVADALGWRTDALMHALKTAESDGRRKHVPAGPPETAPETPKSESWIDAVRRLADPAERGSVETREQFTALMWEAFERCGMEPWDISDDLGLPRSAVFRWIEGRTAPNEVLWPTIVEWISSAAAATLIRIGDGAVPSDVSERRRGANVGSGTAASSSAIAGSTPELAEGRRPRLERSTASDVDAQELLEASRIVPPQKDGRRSGFGFDITYRPQRMKFDRDHDPRDVGELS